MGNKIKDLLGKQYTGNSIKNYLNYVLLGKDTCPSPNKLFGMDYEYLSGLQKKQLGDKYDAWRKKYDLDVIWLDGNLKADTIFSVWNPLKMCLQCSDTYPYSERGNEEKPYKSKPYLPNICNKIDEYLPYNDWKPLYDFVELAATKANVMELPKPGMQTRGIKELIDGKWEIIESFFEQMPRTLYECFNVGEFQNKAKGRDYFTGNDDVVEWVTKEKLTPFFSSNNEISIHTIKPLIESMKSNDVKWVSDKEELIEMLENFILILKARNKELQL